jgi:uncharacterized protein
MIKARCPICERKMEDPDPKAWPDFPFCSARCRPIDLERWLGGAYRIAAGAPEDSPAESDDADPYP